MEEKCFLQERERLVTIIAHYLHSVETKLSKPPLELLLHKKFSSLRGSAEYIMYFSITCGETRTKVIMHNGQTG